MHRRLAVLGYHKVGDIPEGGWPTWNYVSTQDFERQMQYLTHENWIVLNVNEFLAGLKKPEHLPEKSVLITFDDGYRSNLLVAAPLLKQHNFPAVVFVPTDYVGSCNSFDADIFYEPKEEICSWQELKLFESLKISVESHGIKHSHFSELPPDTQKEEILGSKRILEEKLNKSIRLFSFPYGDDGKDHLQTHQLLVSGGYEAAFLYGGPPIEFPIMDRFRLSRVPIGSDSDFSELLK